MASANQEQNTQTNNAAGHSLAMQRQQQQQQELVKLLAQHFHHQFYQLAANNGSSQLSGTTTSKTNSNAANRRLQPLPSLSAYQQPPGAHYANETPLLSSSGCGFDLNGMNLVASAGNQMLHNHILRSQATNHTDHSNSLVVAGGGASGSVQESLIDFSIRNSLSPYPLNDMNLFHALGLNLTNNQLVLSLQQQQKQQQQQQQSLVQTSAARQYEVSRNEIVVGEEEEIHQINRRNSNGTTATTTTTNQLIGHEGNHNTDGKELLKFSINTILGRGSPNQSTGFDTLRAASAISNQVIDVRKANSFSHRANESFKLKRNNIEDSEKDERLSAADCDSNDSCSDSSLITASTPIPQTSNSILFNQSNPPDHRSAHVNNAGSLSNNQPPQRNNLQAHHHTLPFLPGSSAFPWTVAARGKPRRGMMRRAVFSDSQRVGLEKRFQLQKYISKPDRKKLAEKLGLRDSQVKIWFQNRRMKWRNSKERELLSAGGSREQTLPTRNNPNPDLSDVGETIKRLTTNNGPSSNDTATN